MRILHRPLLLLVLLVSLVAIQPSAQAIPATVNITQSDGVILGYLPEVEIAFQARGLTVQSIEATGLHLQTLTSKLVVARNDELTADQLFARLKVEFPDLKPEPNWQVSASKPYSSTMQITAAPQANPSDPELTKQWHLGQNGTKLRTLWDDPKWPVATGAKEIIEIGTGAGTHPDLVYARKLMAAGLPNPNDEHGFSTHHGGVLAATTNNALFGASYRWRYPFTLSSCRALDRNGMGSVASLIDCLNQATALGIPIATFGIGTPQPSALLKAAVDSFQVKGIVVAAVGDNRLTDPNGRIYPGAYARLPIGATGQNGQLAAFSSLYPRVTAPGVDIWSTALISGQPAFTADTGTGPAAANAAGVIAMIWSQWPDWQNQEVADRLEQTADDAGPVGFDTDFGYGKINAWRAIRDPLRVFMPMTRR